MKKIKVLSLVLAACLLVACFAGCTVSDVSEVMTVDGVSVTAPEFKFYLDVAKSNLAGSLGGTLDSVDWEGFDIGEGKTALDMIKENAYESLISAKAASAEAKKRNLSASAEELKTYEEYIVSMTAADKKAFLDKYDMPEEVLTVIATDMVLADKLNGEVSKDENISKELTEEEKENLVRAKHILVTFSKEDGTTITEEEALAEANRIKGLITNSNFDSLMAEYSEDPGSESEPDGYTFYHGDGQFIEEFDNAAFALKVGEVSEPVKTSYGYHIIKRVEFDASSDEAIELVKNKRSEDYLNKLNEDAKAKTVKNEKKIKKIK